MLQFLQKKSRVLSDSIKILETSWGQSSKEISIEKARNMDIEKIYLHSQIDSKNFYQQLGFIQQGETFFEADKLHIEMILK